MKKRLNNRNLADSMWGFLPSSLFPFILAVTLASEASAGPSTGNSLPVLTTVQKVRGLIPEQAKLAHPVRIRGVVTFGRATPPSFFVQDETGGIYVRRDNSISRSTELRSGQLIEVVGVSAPGNFAPIILEKQARVLGQGKMPVARRARFEEIAGGKEDSQWIEVHGIVHSSAIDGSASLIMNIDIGGGGLVRALIRDFADPNVERFVDSTVRVRGVCATDFNKRRQFLGIRLFVTDLSEVQIEEPAPPDPFAIPVRPITAFSSSVPDSLWVTG